MVSADEVLRAIIYGQENNYEEASHPLVLINVINVLRAKEGSKPLAWEDFRVWCRENNHVG